MSFVSAQYTANVTTNENLAIGPGDSIAAQHTGMNTAMTLNTGTTPKGQATAPFAVTLSSGAATVDLTAVPASVAPTQVGNTPAGATINGSTCGAGSTATAVQVIKLQAPGTNANPITVTPGASNGYKASGKGFIFQTGGSVVLKPGDEITWASTAGNTAPTISGSVKTIDLAGTGADVLNMAIVLG